jgi:hypothetical protein
VLKEAGMDEILVYNDRAAMRAWGMNQKLKDVEDNFITFMGDPLSEVPPQKCCPQCGAEGDPAGDAYPSATCHEVMLQAILTRH